MEQLYGLNGTGIICRVSIEARHLRVIFPYNYYNIIIIIKGALSFWQSARLPLYLYKETKPFAR